MQKINIKGNLNDLEFKKFKELSKEVGSQIGVLRLLLNKEFEEVADGEAKNKLKEEIDNLKNDFSELKKHLESIDERLSVLINILSYTK
jgi:SMC interacting uncharacterized protein involved in chromosome segregation